jgi:hypothetical protein
LIEEGADGARGGAALGAHLEACGACREFRRGREALAALVGGLERVSAPDDFEFRLRARMAARRASPSAPLLRRLRLAPALTAAAVAACLLVAAVVSFRNNPPAAPSVAVQEAPAAPAAPVTLNGAEPTPVRAVERNAPPALVARVRTSETPRGRVLAAADGAGKRGGERPRRAAVREDSFGVRAAAVIEGNAESAGLQAATRAVPLRTSPETLRVVLRDERGGSQVLPMRSVSFGSQTPVGRGPRVERASYKDKEGVW